MDEGSEEGKDGPLRRVRTKFSPEQIGKLEKIFTKHKYLDAGERVKTAQKLNLSETQVRGDHRCGNIYIYIKQPLVPLHQCRCSDINLVLAPPLR